MTESEKKRVINKTVAIVKNVLSNPFVIGFDMSGEPYDHKRECPLALGVGWKRKIIDK